MGDPGGVWAGALGVAVGRGVALSAAALVPLTPLLWPLVWNDFRELQLVAPFVALGRPGRPRAIRPLGRAGDRRDARLPAGVRRRGVDVRHPAPATAGVRWATTLRWRRAMVLVGLWLVPLRLLRLPEVHGRPRGAGFVRRPVPRPEGVGRRDARDGLRGPDPRHGLLGRARCAWHPAWRSWPCPGSGASATADGPCGSSRPPSGTTSATPCRWWPWCSPPD